MDPLERNMTDLGQVEALSPKWQIVLVILYSTTAILSFLANSLVLAVSFFNHWSVGLRRQEMLLRKRRSTSEPGSDQDSVRDSVVIFEGTSLLVRLARRRERKEPMRIFLVNLAISGLFIAIFAIPFTYTEFMLGRWVFTDFLCSISSSINTLAVFVSVFTMVWISLDRFFAILKPLEPESFVSRHSLLLIGFTWLAGVFVVLPQIHFTCLVAFKVNNVTYYSCRETWPSHLAHLENIYSALIILITFILPMLILLIIYGRIAFRIWNRDSRLRGQCPSPSGLGSSWDCTADVANDYRRRSSIKAIRLIVTIVLCFFVCWLPIQTFQMVFSFCRSCLSMQDYSGVKLYVLTYFIFHFLAMAHSIVNPIIYCFMCKNFQKDLKVFFGIETE